jgi:hypothetical protein
LRSRLQVQRWCGRGGADKMVQKQVVQTYKVVQTYNVVQRWCRGAAEVQRCRGGGSDMAIVQVQLWHRGGEEGHQPRCRGGSELLSC